jgi:hypothetical protein
VGVIKEYSLPTIKQTKYKIPMKSARQTFLRGMLVVAVLATWSLARAEIQTTGTPGSPGATTTIDGRYLPPPPQQFHGDIQPNAYQSKPDWPALVTPPKRRAQRPVDHDR